MHGRSLESQNKVNCSVLWPVKLSRRFGRGLDCCYAGKTRCEGANYESPTEPALGLSKWILPRESFGSRGES